VCYLAMHRQTNARLCGLGITADQFVCMVILYHRDGIIQKELAELATSDQNTIRAMLALLEKKRYLTRKSDADDGRARVVRLTPKGRKVTEQAMTAVQGVREMISARVSEDEARVLNSVLARISNALL
jgi:DNA-binding MarR family transcriptional regulator